MYSSTSPINTTGLRALAKLILFGRESSVYSPAEKKIVDGSRVNSKKIRSLKTKQLTHGFLLLKNFKFKKNSTAEQQSI
jgi:hypothetical protein